MSKGILSCNTSLRTAPLISASYVFTAGRNLSPPYLVTVTEVDMTVSPEMLNCEDAQRVQRVIQRVVTTTEYYSTRRRL
jgi:hypothetical protein